MTATIIPFPKRQRVPMVNGTFCTKWFAREVMRIRNEKDIARGWPPRWDLNTMTKIDQQPT